MRTLTKIAPLLLGLSALAADNPFAGGWRLNPEKSTGPAPSCVQNGILTIAPEIFTGASNPHATGRTARVPESAGARPAKCTGVYKFTASPDRRTLTLTQPQIDPGYRAVFDRQQP